MWLPWRTCALLLLIFRVSSAADASSVNFELIDTTKPGFDQCSGFECEHPRKEWFSLDDLVESSAEGKLVPNNIILYR